MIDDNVEITKLFNEWSSIQEITPPDHMLNVIIDMAKEYELEKGHESLFKNMYWDGKNMRPKQ